MRKGFLKVFTFWCFGISVWAQELSTFESEILPNFSFRYSSSDWSIQEEFPQVFNLPIYIIKLTHSNLKGFIQMSVRLPKEIGWEVDGDLFIAVSELGFVGQFVRIPSLIDNSSFYYLSKSLGFNQSDTVTRYPIKFPMFIPISENFLSRTVNNNYWGKDKPTAWLFIDLKTTDPEFIATADLIVASLQLTLCNDAWVCDDEK